jgi:ribosome-associated translation inhibitor RaiA
MIRMEIHGVDRGPSAALVTRRLAGLLTALPVRATAAELRVTDENGPKGGEDVRCGLTVKLPGHPSLHVDGVAPSVGLAFDIAATKLERRLGRTTERFRDFRRHPKKYFAAAREWWSAR